MQIGHKTFKSNIDCESDSSAQMVTNEIRPEDADVTCIIVELPGIVPKSRGLWRSMSYTSATWHDVDEHMPKEIEDISHGGDSADIDSD